MPEIKTELLFKVEFDVPPTLDLGETPYGRRRIARVAGGTFEGPKMKGRVLDGGGDWLLLRRDGVLQLDVRVTLETDDKQHIYMSYRGYRHGPKDVIERLNKGEPVDPSLLLLPLHALFRDGLGEVCLAQRRLRRRDRRAPRERADLSCVPGDVRTPPHPGGITVATRPG